MTGVQTCALPIYPATLATGQRIRDKAAHQHEQLAVAIDARDATLAASIAGEHFVLTERMIRDLVRRVRKEGGEP